MALTYVMYIYIYIYIVVGKRIIIIYIYRVTTHVINSDYSS